MSSDSGWSSSDEEPEAEAATVAVMATPPVIAAVPKETKQTTMVREPLQAKLAFLGVPVTLTRTSKGEPLTDQPAGAVVIFDSVAETFMLYIYDAGNQYNAYVSEVLSTETVAAVFRDKKWSRLPLAGFTVSSITAATARLKTTALSKDKKGKKQQFQMVFTNSLDLLRCQFYLLLAVFCGSVKHVAASADSPFAGVTVCKAEEKGGKACKDGFEATILVRPWVVEINRYDSDLSIPSSPGLLTFAPQLNSELDLQTSGTAEVFQTTVTVQKDVPGALPSLGHAAYKMETGGKRLVLVPCLSPLVQSCPELREKLLTVSATAQGQSAFLLFIQMVGFSKPGKRKKGKKPRQSTTATAAATDPLPAVVVTDTAPAAIQQQQQQQQPLATDSTTIEEATTTTTIAAAPAAPAVEAKSRSTIITTEATVLEQLAALQGDLQLMQSAFSKAPRAQLGFIIKASKRVLQAAVGAGVDAEELKADLALVVKTYKIYCQSTKPGSFQVLLSQLTAFSDAVENVLDTTDQLLHPAPVAKKKDTSGSKQHARYLKLQATLLDLDKELTEATEHNATVEQDLIHLREQQMKLLNKNTETETEIKELERSVTEMGVFEMGMKSMREMLENEMIACREAREAVTDVKTFMQVTNLAWVPCESTEHCLLCHISFTTYGEARRRYCRICGRVFCSKCTHTELEVDEIYGQGNPVHACDGCVQLRISNSN